MPINITHPTICPPDSCIEVGKPEIWNQSLDMIVPSGSLVGNLGVSDAQAEPIGASALIDFLGIGDVALEDFNGDPASVLTGTGWATLPSGSDPWTVVKLASDFTTSSATAVDVTDFFFTPAANQTYEFEGKFLLRTATATVGPRPGLAWPTGLSDGACKFETTSSLTAMLTTNGTISASVLVEVGGLPLTTQSYLGELRGLIVAGSSPSGNLRIQLASETALTNVTMRAGSFLRYRQV